MCSNRCDSVILFSANSAWVRQGQHAVTDRVYRRIGEMTGLAVKSAEDLHVLNYGVGGHYDIHVDFFDLANVRTVRIYLSFVNFSFVTLIII